MTLILVQYLVRGEWHFLEIILAMLNYDYKRTLMDYTNLYALKDHIKIWHKIFFIKSYNCYTYNSRLIKNKLPDISLYSIVMLNKKNLPQQYINFVRCYYYQPYPPVVLTHPFQLTTGILFTYKNNPVTYNDKYIYRESEYEYISEIFKCDPLQ